MIGIGGTKESAGFGFIGMVGPINAFKFMHVDSPWLSVLLIVVAFFVVPFLVAWILDLLLRKSFAYIQMTYLNLWDENEHPEL